MVNTSSGFLVVNNAFLARGMFEDILPGGIVAQRQSDNSEGKGDCFSACVSMLTGIDLDLLPVAPPGIYIAPSHEGWVHIYPEGSQWDEWTQLLADNGYGITLHPEEQEIEGPYISCVYSIPLGIGHAIVRQGDWVVDPYGGVVMPYAEYELSGVVEFQKITVAPYDRSL